MSGLIATLEGDICESAQYSDHDTGQFFMRIAFHLPLHCPANKFEESFQAIADQYQLDWSLHEKNKKMRGLIMVSQLGHCLNDLLYRHSKGHLPMTLRGVVSNHETYRARVEAEGLPFYYMPVSADTKAEQEAHLLSLLKENAVEVLILARYMQILSDQFCQHMPGRIINIHHSFLPSFKGARPYHRAHERGVKLVGATAHYVTKDLDEGPIIAQDVGVVDHSMSVQKLIRFGYDIESRVLARAVLDHLEHRVFINGVKTVVFH